MFAFVAFVDAMDKSHRTTRCGSNAPAGMDRGPRGPHESCATFRTQRGDMQRHVETGQLVQDAHSRKSSSRFLTMECAPCTVKVNKQKLNQTHKRHKTYGVTPLIAEVGTWQLGRVPPPFGRAEAQTRTPQASRGSNLLPNGDATYAAGYVCEAVATGEEEHIASETRAARDCSVPTGEGGIHLRGYGYGCVSERSLRAYFLALSLALLRATAWVVRPVPAVG